MGLNRASAEGPRPESAGPEGETPFRRITQRVSLAEIIAPRSTKAPLDRPTQRPTEQPVSDTSLFEHRLAHVDFFEQAIVVDRQGNVVASIGTEPGAIRAVAMTLLALLGVVEGGDRIGAPESCELLCEGRTFFGVRVDGLFAVVAPTRRSMTSPRLAELRALLVEEGAAHASV